MPSRPLAFGVFPSLLGVAALASGWSGVAGPSGAQAAPIAARSRIPALPSAPKAPALNDWTTYGYDNARDGFNPNSAAFSASSLAQLHLAWQSSLQDYNTQTQPIVATHVGGHVAVLIVGGGSGNAYGYDALSGQPIWDAFLGQQRFSCGSGIGYFGVGGTAVYDPHRKLVYVPDDQSSQVNGPAANVVYQLNPATGAPLGSVNVVPSPLPGEIDFMHTALTLAPNGTLYAGTSSTCDLSSWRGRVAAVDTNTMSLANVYFTTWGHGGNYSGGGVWGWGGVSLDASGFVYTGSGNADRGTNVQPPFQQAPNEHVGFAEHFIKLSPSLASLAAANFPGFQFHGNSQDLDFSGTPVLFQPLGCNVVSASQGKSGQVILYDTQRIGKGPVARFRFSESHYAGVYIGNPGYSPSTGFLYVAVTSQMGGSLRPPGLVAIQPAGCDSFSILWSSAFGPDSYSYMSAPPRGAPAATAGGLVFATSPCTVEQDGSCGQPNDPPGGALWVLDATTGNVLNGGKPLLTTPDVIRMPPVIDGAWMWVLDNSGNFYGFTLDSHYAPIRAVYRRPSPRSRYRWRN